MRPNDLLTEYTNGAQELQKAAKAAEERTKILVPPVPKPDGKVGINIDIYA